MNIQTDGKWRTLKFKKDVPKRIFDKEFDWWEPEDGLEGFFKFEDEWYHVTQFHKSKERGWQYQLAIGNRTLLYLNVSRGLEQYQIGKATY